MTQLECETKVLLAMLGNSNRMEEMLQRVERWKIKPDYFLFEKTRKAFEVLISARNVDGSYLEDIPILVDRLKTHLGDDFRERYNYVEVSMNGLELLLKEFAESTLDRWRQEKLREIETSAPDLSVKTAQIASVLEYVKEHLPGSGTAVDLCGVSLDELEAPVDDDHNPDALIRDQWLQKGGAAMLVSLAGQGKSVLCMQLAMAWANGRAMLGLRPVHPLKIAIYGTEDNKSEMVRFRDDIKRGLRQEEHWTDEDFARMGANIRLFFKNGLQGKDFTNWIRAVQREEFRNSGKPFDLFIVNPLMGVAGEDISNNDKARELFRYYFDRAIEPVLNPLPGVAEDAEVKHLGCGLIFIHHTVKPQENNKNNANANPINEYAQYTAIGGADLPNWVRAAMLMWPVKNKPGHFYFAGSKRHKQLGWDIPKEVKEKYSLPVKFIRYHDPAIDEGGDMVYWHEVPYTDAPKAAKKDGLDDSKLAEYGNELSQFVERLMPNAGELDHYIKSNIKIDGKKPTEEEMRTIRNYFKDNLTEYGVELISTGVGNNKKYRKIMDKAQ